MGLHTEISRRTFGFGLLGSVALVLIGGVPLGWRSVDEIRFIEAAVEACFPPTAGLPTIREVPAAEALRAYLSRLPPSVAWQARGLFRIIEMLPLARHGSRFSALDLATRTAFLEELCGSTALPRRLMAHSLKQMCAMAYWQHPQTWSHLGYDGPTVRR